MSHVACRLVTFVGIACLVGATWPSLHAAEIARLSPDTWDEYAAQGKEADCIYGDLVLRNDQLVAVIANPVAGRNANMTVKNVAGAILDLTRRDRMNDQLSAYYPGGGRFNFTDPKTLRVTIDDQATELGDSGKLAGKTVTVELTSTKDRRAKQPSPEVTLRYTLADGEPFLRVETIHRNTSDKPLIETLHDAIRADKVFRFGADDRLFESSPVAKASHNVFWASDEWFGQSYGIICEGRQVHLAKQSTTQLEILKDGEEKVTIAPGGEVAVSRKIFPGATLFEVRAIAQKLAGSTARPIALRVADPNGPVAHALVAIDEIRSASDEDVSPDKDAKSAKSGAAAVPPIEKTYPKASYGLGRTDDKGNVHASLPIGEWKVTVRAIGRPDATLSIDTRGIDAPKEFTRDVVLESPGYVAAQITDDKGHAIPAKVSFFGRGGTADPFFGPDTGEVAVHNVYYTHNGRFRQEIDPGRYEAVVSYGPEYDAVFTEIEVERGKETPLSARLARSVDTRGWVSTDYHSHSSPSGDNVSSQTGRVLNLLCEQIEFAPCTEHNRIDTYVPILKRLGVEQLMATCSGMELTGSPLPVNHQNAFPLVRKPHTQDGGAPEPHLNPEVQIERLALWDGKSDKLVQSNHPNLPQMLGDRDLNGKADDGFRKMFGFMDVVEIHPPEGIFQVPTQLDTGKGPRNPIFHWMQMLNMGFRIPGVVNTDAHYNFHGSGGLRNYVRSSTDNPAKIDTMQMVHQSEAGHITITNGPFLEVSARASTSSRPQGQTSRGANSDGKTDSPESRTPPARRGGNPEPLPAIPGDDLVAPEGQIELAIRVQCPNWFDINRVQAFLNGRADAKLNFTRRDNGERFGKEAVRFEAKLPLHLAEDTHIIVAAAGEGLTLGPVMGPSWGKQMPVAVSNPIFVDVDGGGFHPNGDRLGVALPLDEKFRHE